MENIPVLGQTSLLLASSIILLALCLGIVFYFWSLHLFKKIELLISNMRENIDSLENLSQSIYETAYWGIKEEAEYCNQRQTVIAQKISNKLDEKEPEKQKAVLSNKRTENLSPEEEQDKYQNISEMIIYNLKRLLEEKKQVTAQELVYAMPNDYSLADIYQVLELMKENNQIKWEDKSLSPQSELKIP